jgi:hypothetical protein
MQQARPHRQLFHEPVRLPSGLPLLLRFCSPQRMLERTHGLLDHRGMSRRNLARLWQIRPHRQLFHEPVRLPSGLPLLLPLRGPQRMLERTDGLLDHRGVSRRDLARVLVDTVHVQLLDAHVPVVVEACVTSTPSARFADALTAGAYDQGLRHPGSFAGSFARARSVRRRVRHRRARARAPRSPLSPRCSGRSADRRSCSSDTSSSPAAAVRAFHSGHLTPPPAPACIASRIDEGGRPHLGRRRADRGRAPRPERRDLS